MASVAGSDLPILPEAIPHFRTRLLDWFQEAGRDLPWRRTHDPYRIWVSEVMLQQTRVETAIPYYLRWMERFPRLEALAEADREEVLGAWAGLGYYSRARNLHDAARQVRERHGGRVPKDPDQFRELPGVGDYTAGAVASIAFGIPVPAVDGNVRRVLARLGDLPDPSSATLRRWARELLDPDEPGNFNQALMELGATLCTPRAPRCQDCPVASWCGARRYGTQEARPAPRKRGPVREVHWGVAVLMHGDRVLLSRRGEEGLLGGMWEFPSAELAAEGDPREGALQAARAALGSGLGELEGAAALGGSWTPLPSVPHLFSHIRALYHPLHLRLRGSAPPVPRGADPAGLRWVPLDRAHELPLPAAQLRILQQLREICRDGP